MPPVQLAPGRAHVRRRAAGRGHRLRTAGAIYPRGHGGLVADAAAVLSGVPMPLPADELDAGQLAFLLALADAYKARFVGSFGQRSAAVQPVGVSVADILQAQNNA